MMRILTAFVLVFGLSVPTPTAVLNTDVQHQQSIQLAAPKDTEAPVLADSDVSFSTGPQGNVTLKVRVQITDATGTRSPYLTVSHRESGQSYGFGTLQLVEGNAQNGTWERRVTIPSYAADGNWEVSFYPLDDTLGNSRGPGFQTLAVFRHGEKPSFVVVGPSVRSWLDGEARIGETIRVPNGTWKPYDVDFSYQWMRDGVPIPGATAETYKVTVDDAGRSVSAIVTGTANGAQPVSVQSNPAFVPYRHISGSAVHIQGGSYVGEEVTAVTGDWTPADVTLSYQWMRGDQEIGGATNKTYIIQAEEAGSSLSVKVTGSMPGAQAIHRVSEYYPVQAKIIVGDIEIQGSPTVGSELTAQAIGWKPEGIDFQYEWLRNGTSTPYTFGNTYTVLPGDIGATISVRVTAKYSGAYDQQFLSPGIKIRDKISVGKVAISGTAKAGSTLTAKTSNWDPDGVKFSYQWLREGTPISGATKATYSPSATDVNKRISVRVTGTLAHADKQSVTSATVTVKENPTASMPNRLAGADRFATAVAISKASFKPGVGVAYVANGMNFPDALAGAAAAGVHGGPVLLTTGSAMSAEVKAELKRLKPKKIVVLGGTGVVTNNLQKQLNSYTSGSVSRLAGGDRFATAVAISKASFKPGVGVAYVANGMNFPDALAGAAAAGVHGGPVLLTTGSAMSAEVKAELKRLKPKKIVVLGGTGVVTTKLHKELQNYIVK